MISGDKIGEVYENIPQYENGKWTLRSFESRIQFADFIFENCFKEPGEYNLNDVSLIFKAEGNKFETQGYYCEHVDGTLDYIDYWDDQKLKCRKGIFVIDGNTTWYLPRDYYMWINFLPIKDKVTKTTKLTDIWDTQIYMALYECLAELYYKHAIILKKRQFGSSFYHVAKLVNSLWFEQGAILKMGASLGVYVTGAAGSWVMADLYRSHLNRHTAWVRPMTPDSVGSWAQKIEVTEGSKKYSVGTHAILQALSFEQSDTAGVGGLCTIFFYEEAGIAKSMDKTYEFLRSALELGEIVTGFFVASGSVGDLKQCKPLKAYMERPEENGFFGVRNKYANEKGTVLVTGLFIPEQYSMPPYIDKYGNSLVEEAFASLQLSKAKWKNDLTPELYQLRVSQKPSNMTEAFASREESKFPLALIEGHKLSIGDGNYPYEMVTLEKDNKGVIHHKQTKKPAIYDFPVPKNLEDKTGSIVVWEKPIEDAKWGTYYASVDPVAVGKTSTSDSLCSIYVYMNPIEITRYEDGKYTTFIVGDKIVAAWAGRFDDINDTHERLMIIIEWYNAWTLVENNISQFIQYVMAERKQKYLVPKNQMIFLKELKSNESVYSEYGWRNTGVIFSKNLLEYLIAYLKEVVQSEKDADGNIINPVYGITRIPDIMAMNEMTEYVHGLNVDRLVSLAALIAFAKLQQTNKGTIKRFETEDREYLDNSDKIYNLKVSPFKHVGGNQGKISNGPPRNAFKRLR